MNRGLSAWCNFLIYRIDTRTVTQSCIASKLTQPAQFTRVLKRPDPISSETPTVEIAQGTLVGSIANSQSSVASFKGIPYATAPIGSRRWRPPETPIRWEGRRLATAFGPDAMQQPYPPGSFYARLLPSREVSEDCLYLNVWSPDVARGNLPVMVWIHGGALTRGSGALDLYEGSNLAAQGVVVVTLNYRLGVFGYFAHPELVAESEHNSAGNYGLLDQVKALTWIRDNIAAFGGDAGNVTLFGQSAGAWSISALSVSPLAGGLFHKVIGESGARLEHRPDINAATAAGVQLAKTIGAESLEALRKLPGGELLEAAEAAGFQTNEIVDGWAVPEQPYESFAAGRQHRVPTLLGFNANEATTLVTPAFIPPDVETYTALTTTNYGDLSAAFLSIYPADNLQRSAFEAFRDYWFGWQMVTWAKQTRRAGQNAFLYYFAHSPPGPQSAELGAYHAAEIPYVFDNIQALPDPAAPDDHRLGAIMSSLWVAFATTGTPYMTGLPTWPVFEPDETNYLLFENGGTVSTAAALLQERWPFWDVVMDALRQSQ